MDPVKILPTEILNQIWSQLSLSDLLSCRAVSRLWLESIVECSEVWRPLCCKSAETSNCLPLDNYLQDDFINDYYDNNNRWFEYYLEEAKSRWPWKVGLFGDDVIIEDCQYFCCTEEFIYLVNSKHQLSKYSSYGTCLNTRQLPADYLIEEMCTIKNDIAMLCKFPDVNKIVVFNEELVEILIFVTNDEKLNYNGERLWTQSADDEHIVIIYWARNCDEYSNSLLYPLSSAQNKNKRHDNKKGGHFIVDQLVNILPGTILMPLLIGWCTEFEGLVTLKYTNNNIDVIGGNTAAVHDETLYKYDHTAMSRADESLSMFTNSKDIIVIIDKKVIGGKHVFCTVLVYQNETRLHRADIPLHLKHWCFTNQYLVLASITCISTIELSTGQLFLGKDYDVANNNVNIYRLKSLFNHSRINWIIIDHYNQFVIYDVKNNTNISVIEVHQRTPQTLYSLNYLTNFYLYQLPDKRLLIKNAIKPS